MTEDRLILQVCIVYQIIGLVDVLKKDRVQVVLLLAELHRIVDSVLDLANHVLCSLVLEILEVHLDSIKRVY